MSGFLDKVTEYCKANRIDLKNRKVVAGVSGGADSTALLLVLLHFRETLNVTPYVVHINHMLRGKDADADEEFVRDLCEKNGVSFTSVRKDVAALAKEKRISTEEAGRAVRYEAFGKVLEENGADYIAVAHNLEDQAETVLFRLFRGTGIDGLAGMTPQSGKIIRPLLAQKRSEIEKFVAESGISFRTDASNLTREYSRNRIRLDILPVARNYINSASAEHIHELSEKAAEASEFFAFELKKAWNSAVSVKPVNVSGKEGENNPAEITISVSRLLLNHPYLQKELIRLALSELAGRKKDITAVHVAEVMKLIRMQTGRKISLPYKMTAEKSYGNIILSKREGVDKAPSPDSGIELSVRDYAKTDEIPKNKCTKWFDYDKINGNCEVRFRREGDYLLLANGHGFSKKPLNRFFIDRHVPSEERDRIPLLACGSHVLWVVGYRATEACLIDEDTKKILEAKIATEAL